MGGRLALWYHIYGSLWTAKKYRQIILFQRIYYLSISLTGLPCHHEPSIALMSMVNLEWRQVDKQRSKKPARNWETCRSATHISPGVGSVGCVGQLERWATVWSAVWQCGYVESSTQPTERSSEDTAAAAGMVGKGFDHPDSTQNKNKARALPEPGLVS